ncbi:hypothetical protein STAFG_4383 [Streptomyces afghaniensis 772]|uniref:Uncharacterized protein n=1 Tax=Streptomyces afghaniensis 772 TaxID=1283301 RepID=S4MXE9_9ACTN|nr:hypothetical protein STAFG_4383 [Streptomyces afghaniensis 772]
METDAVAMRSSDSMTAMRQAVSRSYETPLPDARPVTLG